MPIIAPRVRADACAVIIACAAYRASSQTGLALGLQPLPCLLTMECVLQPIWSAYRAAAYGSGLLTINSATDATWRWNGFIRNNVNPSGYYTDGTTPEVAAGQCWRCIPDVMANAYPGLRTP